MFLDKYKILGTHTGGHDPKANGLAERFVGYIKGRATSYLAHAKMSLKFWYWACMQATIVYRLSQLDKKLAKGSPTFGEAVLIRDPDAEKKSFQENAKECTFRMWSCLVPDGAWVAVKMED